MNQEIISIESAEKIANYDRLVLEKKNIVQYLRNQINFNMKNISSYKELKNKERLIGAQTRIAQAQEILRLLKEEV